MNLRNGRWTQFSPIVAPEYVAAELLERAAELEAKRIKLNEHQDSIDKQIASMVSNAADVDNVAQEADLAQLNVVETLRVEISLRDQLADLLVAIRDDVKTHAQAAQEARQAAEDKAFDDLVAAGWDESEPQTRGFVIRNKYVADARRKADSVRARSTDYNSSRLNQEAIDAIRSQLNQIANQSLRSVGV